MLCDDKCFVVNTQIRMDANNTQIVMNVNNIQIRMDVSNMLNY